MWGLPARGMDSRFRRPLNNRHSRDQPSFPRRRESRAGGSLLGMLGISATCLPQRELRKGLAFACMTDVGCLRGNECGGAAGIGDGFPRTRVFERHSREQQPSFPRRRESRAGGSLLGMLGISATLSPATGVTQRSPFAGTTDVGWPACWGWVPACACMTDVGVPARERRMFGGAWACWGWVPAFAGTTGVWACLGVLGMDSRFRRPLNNRHSREQPSFPRRRESRAGGSLLGMLGISATLSPATGVTQRSPFAGTTGVGCAGACMTDVWGCLGGNDGCLGASACWGWIPAFGDL